MKPDDDSSPQDDNATDEVFGTENSLDRLISLCTMPNFLTGTGEPLGALRNLGISTLNQELHSDLLGRAAVGLLEPLAYFACENRVADNMLKHLSGAQALLEQPSLPNLLKKSLANMDFELRATALSALKQDKIDLSIQAWGLEAYVNQLDSIETFWERHNNFLEKVKLPDSIRKPLLPHVPGLNELYSLPLHGAEQFMLEVKGSYLGLPSLISNVSTGIKPRQDWLLDVLDGPLHSLDISSGIPSHLFEDAFTNLPARIDSLIPSFPLELPESHEEDDHDIAALILELAGLGWSVFPLVWALTPSQLYALLDKWEEACGRQEREHLILEWCERKFREVARSVERALAEMALDGWEERAQVLAQVIQAYHDNLWALVPGTLLTQAEGVALSFWKERIYTQARHTRRVDKIYNAKNINTFLTPVRQTLSVVGTRSYTYFRHATVANLDAIETLTISFSKQFDLYRIEKNGQSSRHQVLHYGTGINNRREAMRAFMYYANLVLTLEGLCPRFRKQILN